LLLIHGLGSRSEDWTPEMPDYVKQGFRVYAIDLLGCGRTDHPDIAYTIQQQTNLIDGFLQAIHVPQADVIGWSMGGWVALQFALQHPQNVRRLVVMDSAGLSFHTSLTPAVFEPHTVPQLKELEALLVPHPHVLPAFFDRALLKAMQRNFPVVHRTVQSMLTRKDLLDGDLQKIGVPVLLVWGQQDSLIPPSVAFRMHQAMPQSVLELYGGCGHIGPATCAGRIVPRVIEFLQSQPPATGGVKHG
jgi:pimeloyl-ACP methyl ester carboxylesterase